MNSLKVLTIVVAIVMGIMIVITNEELRKQINSVLNKKSPKFRSNAKGFCGCFAFGSSCPLFWKIGI